MITQKKSVRALWFLAALCFTYSPLSAAKPNYQESKFGVTTKDCKEDVTTREELFNKALLSAALFSAIKDANVDLIQELIALGGDVNVSDKYGDRPLHVVSEHYNPLLTESKRVTIAKLLIQAGADVHALGYGGKQPLHCAAQWGLGVESLVELYLAHGVEVNAKDDYEYTPIMLALESLDVHKKPVPEDMREFLGDVADDVNREICKGTEKVMLRLVQAHAKIEIKDLWFMWEK